MSDSAITSITTTARPRVDRSEQPGRFLEVLHRAVEALGQGAEVRGLRGYSDPVRFAAEVEALAGVRRMRALAHRDGCPCDACTVRRRTAAHH